MQKMEDKTKMKLCLMRTLLLLCLICGLAATSMAADTEELPSGTMGNLNWRVSRVGYNYKLTIVGTGEMDTSVGEVWSNDHAYIEIEVGEGITTICDDAFNGCLWTSHISLPSTLKTIGNRSFAECWALESLSIPEGVESIGEEAFKSCKKLKSINIPEGVKTIGASTFEECKALEKIRIPRSVETIGAYAFYGSGIVSVEGGWSVESIGSEAFAYCTNLESITIQERVHTMDYTMFRTCTSLKDISVLTDNTTFSSHGGALYSKDKTQLLCCPPALSPTLDIPEGVTRIGDYAVAECNQITTVNLPDTLREIGVNAFNLCKGLTSITIPEGVTTIKTYAFQLCTGLEKLVIPNSVTTMGESIALNCTGLKEFTLPDPLTSVHYATFKGCTGLTTVTLPRCLNDGAKIDLAHCPNLTAVYFRSGPPTDVADKEGELFAEQGKNLTIYYPSNLADSWTSGVWGEYYNLQSYTMSGIIASGTWGDNLSWELDANGTMTVSGNGEMKTGDSSSWSEDDWYAEKNFVSKIVIEQGVTTLSDYAFNEFTQLQELILPVGMTTIGHFALDDCSALKKITIPYTVTTFGLNYRSDTIFADCPNIKVYGNPRSDAQAFALTEGYDFEAVGMDTPTTDVIIAPAGDNRTNADVEAEINAAIKNHTRIVLEDGVYILSDTLDIRKVFDVTIEARHPGKVELLLADGTKPVVYIGDIVSRETFFIDLNNLIIGHETGGGIENSPCGVQAEGYVVEMSYVTDVTIDGCDLWGCGVIAVYMSCSNEVTVKDSILRDCVLCAVYSRGSQADFTNCVISGNAYDTRYRNNPCIINADLSFDLGYTFGLTFTDCSFYNNYNPTLISTGDNLPEAAFTNCTYQDNAWQKDEAGNNLVPKKYGVCLGGVVWQAIENPDEAGLELVLNRDVQFADGTALESKNAAVPAYSDSSRPWGKLTISETSSAVTPGDVLTIAASQTQPGTTPELKPTTTVSIDYAIPSPELIPKKTYYFSYVIYDSHGKMLSCGWDQVTFDKNFIAEFELEAQEAGNKCRIFLVDGETKAPQTQAAQVNFS